MNTQYTPGRLTDFDNRLIGVLRDYGYECTIYATKVKLRCMGIRGFSTGFDIPYAFNSVFAAAEHLIPVIRDDNYRNAIHGVKA